jgi:predicted kinase
LKYASSIRPRYPTKKRADDAALINLPKKTMAQVHLIEGPVGVGKSTFALQLSKRHTAPRFTLDDWMATLFRPDRPSVGVVEWYVERKERCIDQIWKLSCGLIDAGSDVVLELGLIDKQSRKRFYARADAAGYVVKVYVLDASRETRRERVKERNRQRGETFSMEVPEQFFEIASDMWEPPDESECVERDIQFLFTES